MTDTFLSRWARVKADAKSPPAPEPERPVPAEAVEADAETMPELPDPELPDIETLTKDSDFAPFLRTGVPDHLRKAALSRLWASDPLFSKAEVYDLHMEDYNQPAIPEIVRTAWKLGKGMVDDLGGSAPKSADFTDTAENTRKDTSKDKPTPDDA